jgi:protein involved in polysaccharide export with SLBB domain
MHQSPVRHAPLALVLFLLPLLSGCYGSPDKRILQYLNTDGFGERYTGNAEEENWVDIGDRINYVDTINPDVNGVGERVDIDGTIFLPEVGAVHVAGRTRSEIEALLTKKLAPYYKQTDIQVQIDTLANPKVYYIFGEVLTKGPGGATPHPGDLTIFQAVMRATPDQRKANLGRVRVIRADPRDPLVFTINVGEILRSGDSTYNIRIREGDIIVVPPTLMAQVGYFLSDLITPFTEVISQVTNALFAFRRYGGNQFAGGNSGVF